MNDTGCLPHLTTQESSVCMSPFLMKRNVGSSRVQLSVGSYLMVKAVRRRFRKRTRSCSIATLRKPVIYLLAPCCLLLYPCVLWYHLVMLSLSLSVCMYRFSCASSGSCKLLPSEEHVYFFHVLSVIACRHNPHACAQQLGKVL